jgi:uncharacterized protein YgiM (DUF1202 family)
LRRLVILLAAFAFAAGHAQAAETDQERCYQAFLARQSSRAATFDWPRTAVAEKLSLLEAGIASDPRCAYLHYLRGVLLAGDPLQRAEALKAFEKAVDLVPTFDLAHENIALVHRAEAHRSFERPSLRPEPADDVFRLTRALAALRRAEDVVGRNPLWGPDRLAHLKGLIDETERELDELKSPEGNADYLQNGLKQMVVNHWRANVRAGFGMSYQTELTLKRGETLRAAATHRRYGWIKVRLSGGRAGWVYHNLVK